MTKSSTFEAPGHFVEYVDEHGAPDLDALFQSCSEHGFPMSTWLHIVPVRPQSFKLRASVIFLMLT